MSIIGVKSFSDSVTLLLDSEAFRKADDEKRLDLGYRLLNSRYRVFGKVKELKNAKTINK